MDTGEIATESAAEQGRGSFGLLHLHRLLGWFDPFATLVVDVQRVLGLGGLLDDALHFLGGVAQSGERRCVVGEEG